jgi:2-(1,2-epoxy-1,2-dihydrophenyl)acetyl-CoA isomerase
VPLSFESITFEQDGGKATLTLNRPDALNALNVGMLSEVRNALSVIQLGGQARVLVLKGAGRSFCAGADIAKGTGANTGGGPFDAGRILEDHVNPMIELLADLPIPIVSAVNGSAAGAGCSLALAADFVVAARSSFFLMAFTKVGLVPDAGATWLLPRLVGKARAVEMLMLAERVPAATAHEWGMVYKVVDDDQLASASDELANRLAAGPTRSFALLRKALRDGMQTTLAESLRLERENQRTAGLSEDYNEGVKAFREKRQARFQGR